MCRAILTAAMCLFWVQAAWSNPPGAAFATDPVVAADGAGLRIEFAAEARTDYAVYILDARGRVVRHLQAAVLGDSLRRTLLWDGADDAGRKAVGGPFRVRVGLGLSIKPDRLFGERRLPSPRALAVGQGGELFILGVIPNFHKGDGTPSAQVLDRQGRYLRTIMPWSADLAANKPDGFGVLHVAGQGRVPFVHHGENRAFYAYLREPNRGGGVVTRDGTFLFVNSDANTGGYAARGPAYLMRVDSDGSCPPQGFLGARLAARAGGFPALALSPDEKTLYVTGLDGDGAGIVWRLAMPAADKAEVFVKDLDDPRGLAVDRQGTVYVAERGKDRILALGPDGRRRGELPVTLPDGIAVHRRSGDLYALTGEHSSTLVKLSWTDKKSVAALDLPTGAASQRHADRRPVLALDDQADPPVLWLASLCGYSGWQVRRIEDGGSDGFVNAREVAPEGFATLLSEISAHPEHDLLLLRQGGLIPRFATLDPRTGQVAPLEFTRPGKFANHGEALSFGRDGYLYFQTRGTAIAYNPAKGLYRYRLDPDTLRVSPAPWPRGDDRAGEAGTRVHGQIEPHLSAGGHIHTTEGSLHMLARGVGVNARGHGAMIVESRAIARRGLYHVLTFGPDGQVADSRAVNGLPGGGTASVRIDNAGNIYIADASRPQSHVVRPEFRGQVPEDRRLPDGQLNWYPAMSGSILKFPPAGGRIGALDRGTKVTIGYGGDQMVRALRHPDDGKERTVEYGGSAVLAGALWQREVVSLVPLTRGGLGLYSCSCEQLRFDIDPFGRIFAPDTLRYQLAVLDTDGNLIGRFGNYGNGDDLSGDATDRRPALRFAWPRLVAVNAHGLYVYDDVNGRMLRATLAYAAEKTAPAR